MGRKHCRWGQSEPACLLALSLWHGDHQCVVNNHGFAQLWFAGGLLVWVEWAFLGLRGEAGTRADNTFLLL